MRIGIDLGGTKIEIAALDACGAIVLRRRVPSPSDDYARVVDTIAALVADAEREIGPGATIGIGTPGTVSRATGRMKNCNSTCLNGQPLPQDLEARLGPRVRIANDANCFALSEAIDGAAAGARCVFGVILGTGVGGGIVIDGRVVDGPNGITGEWGHNALPSPTPDDEPAQRCYCGRRGCIETYLSGRGWAADYALHHPGAALTAPEIVARARAGDADARQSFDRYCDRLARGLGAVINVLDPDVIVLGGGLSNIDELCAEIPRRWHTTVFSDRIDELCTEIPRRWHTTVFSDRIDTRLVRNVHGDSSGVLGAAYLWPASNATTAATAPRNRTSS